MSSPDVVQLPNTGRLSRRNSAKVLGVLEQAPAPEAAGTSRRNRADNTDRVMDKLVSFIGPLQLVLAHLGLEEVGRVAPGMLRQRHGCGPDLLAQLARLHVPQGGLRMHMW